MEAFALLRDAATEWWRNWLRLTVLNLVWMVSWLLVLTGPPVTLAVYAYLERLAANDEMTTGEFLAEVRRNLLTGWLWALPVLALVASLLVSLPFYAQFAELWARAAELAVVVLVLGWLFVQFFALPYLFVQGSRSLGQAYRNAALTAFASPLYSLVVAVALLVLLVLSVRFMGVTFLFSPVLIALAGTLAVKERLRRFGIAEGT
ncbi:MAG TPA: hypothetical protein VF164_02070 [Trueperaceae bacterium]